jgi:hypothetical protein
MTLVQRAGRVSGLSSWICERCLLQPQAAPNACDEADSPSDASSRRAPYSGLRWDMRRGATVLHSRVQVRHCEGRSVAAMRGAAESVQWFAEGELALKAARP